MTIEYVIAREDGSAIISGTFDAEEMNHVRNRLWRAWVKIVTAEQEGR